MNHNNHIKTYLRLVQDQISACTLEETERMSWTSYTAWQNRYHRAIATARMLRAFLTMDLAIDKMTRTQANENYAKKKQAANAAWSAVRGNTTDLALDDMLRLIARKADDELHEAALLQTKFASSF